MKFLPAFGLFLILVAIATMIRIVVDPPSAEEIGAPLDDPNYLVGCYYFDGQEIKLTTKSAQFGQEAVPISYGLRKTLREVIYPKKFPWYDTAAKAFAFKKDRFELVDLIENREEVWEIQIWTTDYLNSKDPGDLRTVYFRKEECRKNTDVPSFRPEQNRGKL